MSADEFKNKGNASFKAGNHDEAIKFYTEGLKIDDKHLVLYSNRSACNLSKGDLENSLKDANSAIEVDKSWVKGYLRKGNCLESMAKFDEARKAYETGLKIDPEDAGLNRSLNKLKAEIEEQGRQAQNIFGGAGGFQKLFSDPGLMDKIKNNPKLSGYAKQDDFVEKIKSIQQDPSTVNSHLSDPRIKEVFTFVLTDMLSQSGGGNQFNFPGSQGSSNDTTNNDSGSDGDDLPPLEEIKVEDGGDDDLPPLEEIKVEDKEETEDERLQREEEEEIAAENKKKEDDEKEAELIKKKGNTHYLKKEFAEALKYYNEAVKLCPHKMVFRLNRAAVYLTEGKYDESIKEAKEAIEVGRKNSESFEMMGKAYVRIGNAYFKQGQLEKAIEYYNEALTEHRSKLALNSLTRAERLLKKNKEEAYLSEEKAIEAKNEGNDHFKKGDFPAAIKCYRDACKRNPKDHNILNNLGYAFMKMREYNEAVKTFDASLKLCPDNNKKAYLRKAQSKYYMKEYHKALDVFNDALELFKDDEQLLAGKEKVLSDINNAGYDEERVKRAKADPEIRTILSDPAVQKVLKEMREDRTGGAAARHMSNPGMKRKLEKLIASGILQTRG